jgi:hypothetical protein
MQESLGARILVSFASAITGSAKRCRRAQLGDLNGAKTDSLTRAPASSGLSGASRDALLLTDLNQDAAVAAYPGGTVDRVVLLRNGEYYLHAIAVNWPHHVFVSNSFKVVGAE